MPHTLIEHFCKKTHLTYNPDDGFQLDAARTFLTRIDLPHDKALAALDLGLARTEHVENFALLTQPWFIDRCRMAFAQAQQKAEAERWQTAVDRATIKHADDELPPAIALVCEPRTYRVRDTASRADIVRAYAASLTFYSLKHPDTLIVGLLREAMHRGA